MKPKIIAWGNFKINVSVLPFFKRWNGWSWWHFIGCIFLTIIFQMWGFTYPEWVVLGLALIWEITYGFKILWCHWDILRPKWMNERLWHYLGYVCSSDGFGIHDIIVSILGILFGLIAILILS